MQLLKYLSNKTEELKFLHNYNAIFEISKLYNIVLFYILSHIFHIYYSIYYILYSSVPVERLFSTGGQILI